MTKSNLYFFGFVLLSMMCFTSCTFDSQVHFNEDYSGSQVVSFDMKDMMDMVSSFGGGEGGEMDDIMNRFNDPGFADSLRMMEDSITNMFSGTGADNFSMAFDENGVMSMGYDFADLATFEKMSARASELGERSGQGGGQAGQMSEMMSGMMGGSYSQKGKWLTIPFKQNNMLDDMMGSLGEQDLGGQDMDEMMAMMEGFMGESIIFENKYSFARDIKKIKTDLPFTQEGNTITVKYTLSDALDWAKNDNDAQLKLKLK